MTMMVPAPGALVRLTVHFGQQIRHRCATCHHFFRPVPGASLVKCPCGATYEPVDGDIFAVVTP